MRTRKIPCSLRLCPRIMSWVTEQADRRQCSQATVIEEAIDELLARRNHQITARYAEGHASALADALDMPLDEFVRQAVDWHVARLTEADTE